jgi:hypothetical protein
MRNGRCRLHGGKSTGPKTPQGKERARLAGLIHGHRTIEEQERQRAIRALLKRSKRIIVEVCR